VTSKMIFKGSFTAEEAKRWLAEERENTAKLKACVAHRFPPLVAEWGHKYRCERCGATAKSEYVIAYCDGVKAAGGDPREICANVDGGVS
jgi:hypothetical protein